MARRERNIYYRAKEKRYEARYIKGRDENGKAQYGAVYAKTYGEVKERRDERLATIKVEIPPKNSVGTVTNKLTAHLADLKGHVKPSTYNIYEHYLTGYISPKIGCVWCERLTLETLQNLSDELIESGLSVVTVQSAFKFLKAGLKGAVSAEIFKVKQPKPPANMVDVLTRDEQQRLEAAARASDDINRMAVTLMLYTGLRIGECLAVRWGDIDLERRQLHVRQTLQRVRNIIKGDGADNTAKTSLILLSPKTESSERIVPLPSFLIPLLENQRNGNADEHVVSRNGAPVEPRNMQIRFKKLLKVAGLRDVCIHTLRHTYSTRLLESGGDITTLSALLGHANVGVTISTYAHSLEEQKRRSVEALAEVYQ